MPQISVIELVRSSQNSEHRIETINTTPVLRLRDRLLPLISLAEATKLAENNGIDADAELFIIVVAVGAQRFGLIVDRVFDTEEIVVKPVAPILRDISLFSGNTILGDGSMVMILDPNGLTTLVTESQISDTAEEKANAEAAAHGRSGEPTSLLLFEAGSDEPKAVPLGLISRLEEIDMAKIEHSSGAAVIQYRGELMPLVTVEGENPEDRSGNKPVLVFADEWRKVGLVVDKITDIVDQELNIEYSKNSRDGSLGSAILAGATHTVLDVGHYLNYAHGDWFRTGPAATTSPSGQTRVLFVDDSPFFRNLVAPLLKIEGYDVTTADSPARALELREDGRTFDLIITDIEMPDMDGFEFARTCRSSTVWNSTPIIALSSHATAEDFEKGRAVGFDDYVAKFDRDDLISAVDRVLVAERVGEPA